MTAPSTLRVNRMPAPTWHKLKMNWADITIAAATHEPDPACVAFAVPQGVYFAERTELAEGRQDEGNTGLFGLFDASLADADPANRFEDGIGSEAAAWMDAVATRRLVVHVPDGLSVAEPLRVRVQAQDGAVALAAVGVVVGSGASVRIQMHVDAPSDGAGVAGTSMRVFAGEGSHVEIESLQTLASGFKHMDNLGVYQAGASSVDVRQTVLGAAASYTGFACDLGGDKAACKVDTRYLGHGSQVVDFNYVMRQRGANTDCKLYANGVLSGESRKVLRGTIDFVHGCRGSVGNEHETVLITSEQASNKTIPILLCDEDDVQGAHGATIGHVNPEQLDYMRARGLPVTAIEALFEVAVFDRAHSSAFDEESRRAVSRLGTQVLGKMYATLQEED